MEEIKIYIDDPRAVEEKLKVLGASFTQELHVTDTYFKQPEGMVLKLTEDERGTFLTHLQTENGGFKILRQEKIENGKEIEAEYIKEFGIKCILKKRRIFYDFEGYKVNVNLFEDIGNFLIVEGQKVTKDIIEKKIRICKSKIFNYFF